MASSSIGWEELPYARTPLGLDASNLVFKRLDWPKPSSISETYLLSGAATDDDIMRGEETEAIGLLSQIPPTEHCVLILPGTHSKHLLISNGRIETFNTYMTGELFDVLTHHSILKVSTNADAPSSLDTADWKAFDDGVLRAAKSGLGLSLFQTRTRAILKQCPPAQNTRFLSGLLIGAELGDALARMTGAKLLLGGAAHLRNLYARALQVLGAKDFYEFSESQAAKAVPAAHALFLQNVWKR
jgi:2-dehydro-3-deoxygalactonokinase